LAAFFGCGRTFVKARRGRTAAGFFGSVVRT
jgi:hypothetical protein